MIETTANEYTKCHAQPIIHSDGETSVHRFSSNSVAIVYSLRNELISVRMLFCHRRQLIIIGCVLLILFSGTQFSNVSLQSHQTITIYITHFGKSIVCTLPLGVRPFHLALLYSHTTDVRDRKMPISVHNRRFNRDKIVIGLLGVMSQCLILWIYSILLPTSFKNLKPHQ